MVSRISEALWIISYQRDSPLRETQNFYRLGDCAWCSLSRPAHRLGVGVTTKKFTSAENPSAHPSAPKGASDFKRLAASLKRCPDTKPELQQRLHRFSAADNCAIAFPTSLSATPQFRRALASSFP
jgi:hypothetical protein